MNVSLFFGIVGNHGKPVSSIFY